MSLLAVEERFDLAVPFHAIGKAIQQALFPGPENRTDQGKNSGGLHQ